MVAIIKPAKAPLQSKVYYQAICPHLHACYFLLSFESMLTWSCQWCCPSAWGSRSWSCTGLPRCSRGPHTRAPKPHCLLFLQFHQPLWWCCDGTVRCRPVSRRSNLLVTNLWRSGYPRCWAVTTNRRGIALGIVGFLCTCAYARLTCTCKGHSGMPSRNLTQEGCSRCWTT